MTTAMSGYLYEFLAILLYLSVLAVIGVLSFRKNQTASDYMIGGRGLNFWLTALAAHASDMSSWMFIAYPSTVFLLGMQQAWAAIGLLVFMLLNWLLVAPKIRVATEQYNSMTFSSFFENRVSDRSGLIRLFTSFMCIFFYTIYISAGIYGMGILMESLFGLSYHWGIILGMLVVVPYVFAGGYTTLAWIDLFQGLFLMVVIILVPLIIMAKMGGWGVVAQGITSHGRSLSLLPAASGTTWPQVLAIAGGWGLGYFGQPHIVTKFMGIRNVSEIGKATIVGMCWMLVALSFATLVGLVGITYFSGSMANPEELFVAMVRENFNPFVIGIFLCAILAVTINAMSSQVLVLTSSFTEDIYKKILRKDASSNERLWVSRMGVVVASLISLGIAFDPQTTIYSLVLYAWSGLGSSFGPLVLMSLYSKSVNKYGAWAGILVGGVLSATWPYFNHLLGWTLPPLIPGFAGGLFAIAAVSCLTSTTRCKEVY